MKVNCKTMPLLMDEIKRINGGSGATKAVGGTKKLDVASLNSHLICVLCSGYYVEATAVVECLHTFCRSCIVKYLQSNSFCPICDVQILQSKPWSSLRPDKTLQDLVYKLVPGLYQNEMRRRRQFYAQLERKPEAEAGEEEGFPPQGARFFAQDDSISLSLEYYNGRVGKEEEEDAAGEDEAKAKQCNEKPKRYLQCPAAVTVRHLKKFLRMKYGIGLDCWVDIIYNDECLPNDFTLIDVAYTFCWKRTSPMRFSYRIYSKASVRAAKSQRKFQTPRLDEEEEKKKPKRQSSLEQQMQNEYLGNFNLNPTNSSIYKNQNHNKTKSHLSAFNNNNNNNLLKNNNNVLLSPDKKTKREEYAFKGSATSEEESRERMFQWSEDSNTSGLQIISEKEESMKEENSDDSMESMPLGGWIRRKIASSNGAAAATSAAAALSNFAEETVDSFSAKKLIRSKHKSEAKRGKRKHEEAAVVVQEKRRKSDGFDESRKSSEGKRRRSMADEYSLRRETLGLRFSLGGGDEDEPMGNLKNEALRKVFVTKDKPESADGKGESKNKKDGEFKRKKRKKSKHHEGETKRRKTEIVTSSPSIMSFAKDALKFKFKLTPSKPPEKKIVEEVTIVEKEKDEKKEVKEVKRDERKDEEEVREVERDNDEVLPEEDGKSLTEEPEPEIKKSASDKERLLHLRAVRHKPVANKTSPKDYLNTPPSLTISKVDSSEQTQVKSALVESRPSLEIMLVSPGDAVAKPKKSDSNQDQREDDNEGRRESSGVKAEPKKSEILDNFGVLDLSEKSTRTKENNNSNSSSPKEIVAETVERCRKSTHQSILQIAQTLVNRKLSPTLQDNPLVRVGFEGSGGDSSPAAAAAAMRNLKTLSDTAVNILMAAQSKNFASCAAELQKRAFSSIATASLSSSAAPTFKSLALPNSTKCLKDCENGGGLKIPMYPLARERINPIPPVPNLHEIYPRGRGRPLSASRPSTPAIKPGQNQTVRQIPNPFVVLNRQMNQGNVNALKLLPPPSRTPPAGENGEDASSKPKTNSVSAVQNAKPKVSNLKSDGEGTEMTNGSKNGSLEPAKISVSKTINNNIQTGVKNGAAEGSFFGSKNLEERKNTNLKMNNNNASSIRKIENMAKNIESVAAGLTARALEVYYEKKNGKVGSEKLNFYGGHKNR